MSFLKSNQIVFDTCIDVFKWGYRGYAEPKRNKVKFFSPNEELMCNNSFKQNKEINVAVYALLIGEKREEVLW